MKKLLFVIVGFVLVWTHFANACPNLNGTYKGMFNLELRQEGCEVIHVRQYDNAKYDYRYDLDTTGRWVPELYGKKMGQLADQALIETSVYLLETDYQRHVNKDDTAQFTDTLTILPSGDLEHSCTKIYRSNGKTEACSLKFIYYKQN